MPEDLMKVLDRVIRMRIHEVLDEACLDMFKDLAGYKRIQNHLSFMEADHPRHGKLTFALLMGRTGKGFEKVVDLFESIRKDGKQVNVKDVIDTLRDDDRKALSKIGIPLMTYEEFAAYADKIGPLNAFTEMTEKGIKDVDEYFAREQAKEDTKEKRHKIDIKDG